VLRTLHLPFFVALVLVTVQVGQSPAQVEVLKTPHGGIQPQAIVDAQGILHLIYFKGEALAGDLFYVRREAGRKDFSSPIRVNSQPASAVATGTVRGGRIALGKAGRVHVGWFGSGKVKAASGSPMLYARLNDAGTAFEEQRNLMQITSGLDGGGTVTADSVGNVYVAWHGLKIGGARGEDERQVWVARSTDEGKIFAKEAPAWAEPTGVCACCAMQALADSKGAISMLYRSATADVNRDIYLLSSKNQGAHFEGLLVHKWKVPG
jgi:hypothetical protein